MAKNHGGNGRVKNAAQWLQPRNDQYWERLQIFPHAVTQSAAKSEYARKAARQYEKLGRANLKFIANQAGIEYRDKADTAKQLANRLMASASQREFLYLATFLRPRVSAVVEYLDSHAGQFRAAALQAEIENLSVGAAETPKPLTKLIWAYGQDPAALEAIHYYYAWRRLPTLFEFATPKELPADAMQKLETGVKELVTALGKLKHGEKYHYFGRRDLQSHVSVFVLHRKYPPSVKPDYESAFRLQHDYSMVVFAVDTQRKSLLVKVANRAIAEAIAGWAGETLDARFDRAGSRIFADYEPTSVENALLGGYDESFGMDITAISFRHSFAPNHSRISLAAAPLSTGIRDDLQWMRQEQVLRLRSLADVESLKVRFDGSEADIECLVEKEGAIRLRLNDSHIADERAEQLRDVFKKVFGIPLGQRIDPTLLTMGTAEIYQFLLSGARESELLDYHKEALGRLLESELLVKIDERVGRCRDLNCAMGRNQSFADDSLAECPGCQGTIDWQTHTRYEEDPKRAVTVARQLVTQASKWKMDSTPRSFESRKFYRLYPKSDPNRMVCVFVNNRLNATKVEAFQRAMFPILVVHPQGNHRMPLIDPHGIAHIGLPYALSAVDDKPVWKAFQQGLRDVLARLLRMEQERVLRTSRISFDLLQAKPADYDDRKYESDIFNVLRSLFPNTVKWGGGNKPDGFSSLVYFEENDLRKPTNFNFSYDAKYTDSVYPFGIGEFDQMFRYARLLYQPKRLKSLGNRYDAHAIITNSMDESAMKNAADYLWNTHRLGKEHTEFLLIFIRDGFLMQLWQRVRDNESAFRKRSTYLAEYLVRLVKSKQADGYTLLDRDDADGLADEVLAQPEVESTVDHDALKADLKRATGQTAKTGPKGRRPR